MKERIKQMRVKYNYSQLKLGELLNVSQQTIGKWESGIVQPSIEHIKALSSLFEVSVPYLLELTNNPFPDGEELSSENIDSLFKLHHETESKVLLDSINRLPATKIAALNHFLNSTMTELLTESEAELIAMYRAMNEDAKSDVYDFTKLKYMKERSNKPHISSTRQDNKVTEDYYHETKQHHLNGV